MGEFLPYQRGKSLLLLDYYLPVAVGVLGLGEYLMTFEPYGAWHVLYGFAIVEPYLEHLTALHGGKFQFGLYEVHGAEHAAEVLEPTPIQLPSNPLGFPVRPFKD